MSNTIEDKRWHSVIEEYSDGRGSITRAMNTATGVRVQTMHVAEGVISSDSDFISGERWDADAGVFSCTSEDSKWHQLARICDTHPDPRIRDELASILHGLGKEDS
jgi:hypothetical protein